MTASTTPCSVHVISLPRRTDRRAGMTDHLREVGLPFTFLDALDLREDPLAGNYSPERFAARQPPGAELLSDAVVACLLSHCRIWRLAAAAVSGWTLVLEDDARFTCARPIPLLESVMALAGPDDVVLLNSRCRNVYMGDRVRLPQEPHRMYRINSETYLAAGYLVSRGAARRLAASVERDGILCAVDWWQRRRGADWSRVVPIRVVKPDPITQEPSLGSDIAPGDERYFRWIHNDVHRDLRLFAGLVGQPRNPRYWPLLVSRLAQRIYARYAVQPRCRAAGNDYVS